MSMMSICELLDVEKASSLPEFTIPVMIGLENQLHGLSLLPHLPLKEALRAEALPC